MEKVEKVDMEDLEDINDITNYKDINYKLDMRYINDISNIENSSDNLIIINKGLLALGNDIQFPLCLITHIYIHD